MADQLRNTIHSGTSSLSIAAPGGSDQDLITLRPGFVKTDGGDGARLAPRQIIVAGGGNLVVEYRDGTSDTIVVLAPYTYNLQPVKLLAATTATNVTIVW